MRGLSVLLASCFWATAIGRVQAKLGDSMLSTRPFSSSSSSSSSSLPSSALFESRELMHRCDWSGCEVDNPCGGAQKWNGQTSVDHLNVFAWNYCFFWDRKRWNCCTTHSPTPFPTTRSPTKSPSRSPTTKAPTNRPTFSPTTKRPTKSPTNSPTTSPTKRPTSSPTSNPTPSPSYAPSQSPSKPVGLCALDGQEWLMVKHQDEFDTNFQSVVGECAATWTLDPSQAHLCATFQVQKSLVDPTRSKNMTFSQPLKDNCATCMGYYASCMVSTCGCYLGRLTSLECIECSASSCERRLFDCTSMKLSRLPRPEKGIEFDQETAFSALAIIGGGAAFIALFATVFAFVLVKRRGIMRGEAALGHQLRQAPKSARLGGKPGRQEKENQKAIYAAFNGEKARIPKNVKNMVGSRYGPQSSSSRSIQQSKSFASSLASWQGAGGFTAFENLTRDSSQSAYRKSSSLSSRTHARLTMREIEAGRQSRVNIGANLISKFSFTAMENDELSIPCAGHEVQVVQRVDANWIFCRDRTGRSGIVPINIFI